MQSIDMQSTDDDASSAAKLGGGGSGDEDEDEEKGESAGILSDGAAARLCYERGIDPANLRAKCEVSGVTCWHLALRPPLLEDTTRLLEWFLSKGLGSMIDDCTHTAVIDLRMIVGGQTPLMLAMSSFMHAEQAEWLIANGASVSAVDEDSNSVFAIACANMDFEFVRKLVDKVPPDHLRFQSGAKDCPHGPSPMGIAFR